MSHSISFTFRGAEADGSHAVTAQGLTEPPCKEGGAREQHSKVCVGGQIPNRLCWRSRGFKEGVLGRGWRRLESCTHRGHGRLSLLIMITRGAVSKPLLDWPLLCGAAVCAAGKLRSASRWAAKSHTCDGQAAGWQGGCIPEEGHLDVKASWDLLLKKRVVWAEPCRVNSAMITDKDVFSAQGEAHLSVSSRVFGDLA